LGPPPPPCRALCPSGAKTESYFFDRISFPFLWVWLALIKVDSSSGSPQLAPIDFFALVFGFSGGRGDCFEWALENLLVGLVRRVGQVAGGLGL